MNARAPSAGGAPLLVLACGNPDRGDDALGPLFAERVTRMAGARAIDVVVDYQFQVEHALELDGRARVLFVDAAAAGAAPYACRDVQPARDRSFSSHALSAEAVLAAHALAFAAAPRPPAQMLAIRGYAFELGAPPSAAALRNLEDALAFFRRWAGWTEDVACSPA